MTRKNHRKKTVKKSPFAAKIAALKAGVATVAIAALSIFGLIKCLDGNSGSPIDPKMRSAHKAAPVKKVDVGEGKEADPTLVNEENLLKEETPPEPVPEPSPEADTEQDTAGDTDTEAREVPLEERFPLYGAAFHFHTQFKAEPTNESRVIGYARRGATFRVSERISTDGCRNGWYEVAPGGLFACANQGIIVGRDPVSFAPSPPAPAPDQPLPYRYAYITADNTPQYWRVPTEDEAREVNALFSKLSVKEADTDPPPPSAATTETTATATAGDTGAQDTDSEPAAAPTPTDTETPQTDTDTAPSAEKDLFPDYLHMRMAKGYFVSLDDTVQDASRTFQRTVRGRIIPEDRLRAASPSDFEGFLISDPAVLPQVIIVGSGVTSFHQKVADGPLSSAGKVAHLARYDYLGEIQRGRRTYLQIGDGIFVSSRVAAVIRAVEPPKNIQPAERWIDVNLSQQTLVAYEGDRPVFATVVSTGRPGFETPTGEFRIYSKHMTVTMDDTEAGAEAYSIEDVPWVQYFKDSYALHAAFWHGKFGRVRSHGCINLSPKDAKRLFAWTGPELHDGVHGRFATRDNLGTRVVIHK